MSLKGQKSWRHRIVDTMRQWSTPRSSHNLTITFHLDNSIGKIQDYQQNFIRIINTALNKATYSDSNENAEVIKNVAAEGPDAEVLSDNILSFVQPVTINALYRQGRSGKADVLEHLKSKMNEALAESDLDKSIKNELKITLDVASVKRFPKNQSPTITP